MKNEAWERWTRRFNAQNKIYPGQDKNNWFIHLCYGRACINDQALAFAKDSIYEGDVYSLLVDEIGLDLAPSDEQDCYGVLFDHTPSGLRFRVTEQDNEDFKNGKEVYLYGFMPD